MYFLFWFLLIYLGWAENGSLPLSTLRSCPKQSLFISEADEVQEFSEEGKMRVKYGDAHNCTAP
jgi:hypothetical protein